jgi:hypothetical protein
MPSLPPSDPALDERLRIIVESYQRLTGKPLLGTDAYLPPCRGDDAAALGAAMWNASRAIVAHGTEADPVFFYGNRLALDLFEMTFEEFTRLPSRLSAEPLVQEAREKLLEKVAQQGYVDNYSGLRIAKNGRRFMIADCTVWNLVDASGVVHGQAAVFVSQE